MIVEMPTPCDFSETSLDWARAMLRTERLCDLTVYVSNSDATAARRLQGQHGFEQHIIPVHLLWTGYTWCAAANGEFVWSRGAG